MYFHCLWFCSVIFWGLQIPSMLIKLCSSVKARHSAWLSGLPMQNSRHWQQWYFLLLIPNLPVVNFIVSLLPILRQKEDTQTSEKFFRPFKSLHPKFFSFLFEGPLKFYTLLVSTLLWYQLTMGLLPAVLQSTHYNFRKYSKFNVKIMRLATIISSSRNINTDMCLSWCVHSIQFNISLLVG